MYKIPLCFVFCNFGTVILIDWLLSMSKLRWKCTAKILSLLKETRIEMYERKEKLFSINGMCSAVEIHNYEIWGANENRKYKNYITQCPAYTFNNIICIFWWELSNYSNWLFWHVYLLCYSFFNTTLDRVAVVMIKMSEMFKY